MQDLTGKVAVVTGGSSGIGKGIAQRLKEAGATVVIASMNEARIAATAAELGVTGIQVDVTSAASVQALADSVIERFGKVDVIVNNAGVGSMGRVADLSLDDWKWMLDINLWGVIYGIHSFLPLLTANPDGGHVINVGSIASFVANPAMATYTASKMAVVGITEALYMECAEDGGQIKATCVCPGPVKSDIKDSLRNRSDGSALGMVDVDGQKEGFLSKLRWMEPLDVGDMVVDVVGKDQLYVITHPEIWPPLEARFSAIQKAFGA